MTEQARGRSQRSSLRVVVVARSPVVGAGLAALLEQAGLSVAPDFETALGPGFSDSVSARAVSSPDVVVIETTSGRGGPTVTELLADFPGIPAVLLVDTAPDDIFLGGTGVPVAWLRRDAGREELAAAVHAVAAGLDVYDPALGDRNRDDRTDARATSPDPGEPENTGRAEGQRGDEDGPEPLTPREMEVLQKLASGLTNKAIAYDLGISEHTVKYHVGSILTKLDASSRTEAVTVGVRRGLIAL